VIVLTIKEYLSQAYYLDKQIDAKIEQIQHLKDLVYKVSPTLVQDKVSGGDIGNRTEDYICKWLDLEKEIDRDIDRLVDLKQQIKSRINKIIDPKLNLLLTLRYLNFKSWEEIGGRMHYSNQWLYELHKKALGLLETTELT
jgi:DNA-directed RNA polymerase specialized sigma subunit